MKLEDLSKMNALHEKLKFLQGRREDIKNSNMLAIVYQERTLKMVNPPMEDRFIIVRAHEVSPTEQTAILSQIKEGMLVGLDAQIKDIESKILDL